MPIRPSLFKPAWWLRDPHAQTLWPALLRRPLHVPTQRERITMPDGDFLDLDWCGTTAGIPTVILLHGLTGSSRSSYIQGLQRVLHQRGWRSVAVNFRGCSGEPNLTSRCYHSGETGDVDYLYRQLRQREPHTPLAVVGYSLGGNVTLKWLGERGADVDLFAAVAVSVPLRLNHCADRLDRGFSKIYRDRLLVELKDYIHQKRQHLRQVGQLAEWEILERLGDLSAIRSFWEYDDRVVARLYGFRDAEDYYQQASSRRYLHAIRVPTLVIQAEDDPFMTPDVLPTAAELSPAVELEITTGGGHVGFIAGRTPHRPSYWLEQRIPEFLSSRYDLNPKP